MNLRRFALAAAAATMATAALAPAAHASTRFSFATQDGATEISVDADAPHTRLEVTRETAVIAQSITDSVDVTSLQPGDVATLYDTAEIVARATYDDLPQATNVCIGHTAFSATRATGAEIVDAGAYRPFAGSVDWVDATWTADADAVVTLERPLQLGDTVFVMTAATDGDTEIRSSRGESALQCWYDRSPAATRPSTPPPPAAQPTIAPSELVPTGAQLLQMVKGSLSAAGANLRARTTRSVARSRTVSLPFAFPEPGRVDLELVAKHKVIGTGTKSSAVNGKAIVAVNLTTSGRALLKRSKRLKVTVKGTFAATRNGAATSRASLTVTMAR